MVCSTPMALSMRDTSLWNSEMLQEGAASTWHKLMRLLTQRAGRRITPVPHRAACLQHPKTQVRSWRPRPPAPAEGPPAHVMRLADVTHAFWPSASSCSGMGHWLSGASASISM